MCRQERTVKPSAQPTLVRTQHLPPPAKTAPWLRKRRPAGRFLLVTPCIRVRHYGSMHGSVHVHMVYSVRAKLAVRITARFADPRPFCPLSGRRDCSSDWCAGHPGRFGSSPSCSRWARAGLIRACGRGGLPDRPASSIQAAIEALAECPSLALGWKTGTAAPRERRCRAAQVPDVLGQGRALLEFFGV